MHTNRSMHLHSLLFILPALVIFSLFLLFPVVAAVHYSFTDWNGISPIKNFIGLDNYKEIFTNKYALEALRRTFLLATYVVILQNALALLFAELLDNFGKGSNTFKAIFFAPAILSTIIVAYLWNAMYSPFGGVIKTIATAVGWDWLAQTGWLSDPRIALFSVGTVMVWQFFGFTMVIYYGGMQSISATYFEAARIDGANPLQVFIHVKFPLIAPVFTVNIILSVMGALKQFEHIFLMTNGGPGRATETLTIMIYNQSFSISRMGYGTALSMVLLALILFVSAIQLRLLQKREPEA